MVTLKKIEHCLKNAARIARLREYDITRESLIAFLKNTKVLKKPEYVEKEYILFHWRSDVRIPVTGAVQEVQLYDGWTAYRTELTWIIQSSGQKIVFRIWDKDQSNGTVAIYKED